MFQDMSKQRETGLYQQGYTTAKKFIALIGFQLNEGPCAG
jgi:hypothetical protein